MNGSRTTLLGALALIVALSPALAETVDEVIAKHVAARGGEAWNGIETMRLSGQFTAFSETHPFAQVRTRDGRYRIDHQWTEAQVVIATDGEHPWTNNPMAGDWPQRVQGADLQVLERDVELATPFFDYRAKGHQVELVPDASLDGQDVVAIKLTRADGSDETWYLDPDTYLELGRDSPGSDFGAPMVQRTFFDDFREVAGVQVPHHVESQWSTRHRVFAVEQVAVNVAVDDIDFGLPVAIGMEDLQTLAGSWSVKVEQRQFPGAPWSESQRSTAITADLRGGLLEERYVSDSGSAAVRTLSYDRFRERYVLTAINDMTTYLDIQTGTFDDGGNLVLLNVDSDTSWFGFGRTFHARSTIKDRSADGFTLENERSVDGGENWFLNQRLTYTRAP